MVLWGSFRNRTSLNTNIGPIAFKLALPRIRMISLAGETRSHRRPRGGVHALAAMPASNCRKNIQDGISCMHNVRPTDAPRSGIRVMPIYQG
jgi:hypothetical protein